MAIDETILEQTIKDVDIKILLLRDKQAELIRIQENLNEIVELKEQGITDAGVVTVKVHKAKDKRTGKDFTPEDRQKIYDDNVAAAAVVTTT